MTMLPNQSPEPTAITAAVYPRGFGWFHSISARAAQLFSLGIKPTPIFWRWICTEIFGGSEVAGDAAIGLRLFGLSR